MPDIARSSVTCFVIGPIGDPQAAPDSEPRRRYERALQVLKFVIEPACRAVGLPAIRADAISRPGELTDQIFRALRDAPVVIADVTDGNSNVMYELGLRHSRDAITLQVGEKGQLPFDVSTIRTIMFVRTPESLEAASKALEEMLRRALAQEFDHVLATRLWIEDGALRTRPAPSRIPGRLERTQKMKEALERLPQSLNAGTDIIAQVSGLAQRLRAKKEQLDERSAPYDAYDDVFREIESHLRLQADRAEQLEATLVVDIDFIVWGLEHLIEKFWANAADPEKEDVLTIPEFLETITNGMHSVAARMHRIDGLGALHHTFQEPVARISRVFKGLPSRVARFADLRTALLHVLK